MEIGAPSRDGVGVGTLALRWSRDCHLRLGGSILELQRLLSSSTQGTQAVGDVHLAGIFWEEVTKLVLLICLMNGVRPESRSISTFILPGTIFGMLEGIPKYFLQVSAIGDLSLLTALDRLGSITFGVCIVIMCHSLLMLVYGVRFAALDRFRWHIIVPLLAATGLHLLYNQFMGFLRATDDGGLGTVVAFGGATAAAGVCLVMLVWQTRNADAWQQASRSLPWVRA